MPETIVFRFPHAPSDVQRHGPAIARAVALEPDCFFPNTPTFAWDIPVQAQIIDAVRNL